jgi:hypothetical protein
MLQSKAGYIDARPHIRQLDQSSLATHGRTIHWVISDRRGRSRTTVDARFAPESGQRDRHGAKSALCQERTHAPQQKSYHSIISSARVSSVAGSSIPSASAVLRLMNSSIFVDCWTGKLASFSPFRTRPV